MQSNQPHTFVVVTLDPPIRKGQTLYPHIVMQVLFRISDLTFSYILFLPRLGWHITCILYYVFMLLQFETDYVVESTLMMNDDLYATKYKDKLEPTYKVMMLTCFVYLVKVVKSTQD